MARELKEITAELKEWQEENPKERCLLFIAGFEEPKLHTNIKGNKGDVLTCLASAIESIPKVEDLVTEAMDLVNRYRREQKTEDN